MFAFHKRRGAPFSFLSFVLLAVCIALAVALLSFKVMDRDFWWHITAGRIMWQTGGLIHVEPFAYTRAGMAYTANYEWLAQIILYLVHSTWGSTGIILLRTILTLCTGFVLLLIDKKRMHWNAVFVLLALCAARGGLLERPQMFTYIFLPLFVLLGFTYLDALPRSQTRRHILFTFVFAELLWVNLHGGAALLGVCVVGLLALQPLQGALHKLFATVRSEKIRSKAAWATVPALWTTRLSGAPLRLFRLLRASLKTPAGRDWLILCGVIAFLFFELFIHPAGVQPLIYLQLLFTDKTILLINEWIPRDWGEFLGGHWMILLPMLIALFATRRHWLFCSVLFLAMLYLARQAVRHEVLVAIVACAVLLYQLKHNAHWHRALAWVEQKRLRFGVVVALLLIALSLKTGYVYMRYAAQDHLYGYGQFDLARGAYDFLERENVRGNMFNSYGIGGYLLYRGYPDRQVYIDGRNVDFGFDFMYVSFLAGKDPAIWKKLEDLYGFQIALIDFNVVRDEGDISYARHLGQNPDWALVYVDDWLAVYVKRTPEHQKVIDKYEIKTFTPHQLESNIIAENLAPQLYSQAEAELYRVIMANPEGIKARIELGKLYLQEGRFEDARNQAALAARSQPMRAEPYGLRAAIYTSQNKTKEAADNMLRALLLADTNYPNLNYAAAADILRAGGKPVWAWWYGRFAPRPEPADAAPSDADSSGELPTDTGGKPLDLNFEPDIDRYTDNGINAAKAGDVEEARKQFMNALMYDPSRPVSLTNLCALDLQTKNYDEAIVYCLRALKKDPEFADAHFNIALAYLMKGDKVNAETYANLAEKYGKDVRGLRKKMEE